MISGLYKKAIDGYVRKLARIIGRVNPNTITILSVLPALASFYFFSTGEFVLGGAFLIVASILDALDGAVAREHGLVSKKGSYIDAVVDRYVEGLALLGIGMGSGAWEAVYLSLFGSFMTSYAKARAAMEVEVDNVNWPDLMERGERMAYLGLVVPASYFYGFLEEALWLFALLTNVTALQRIWRALRRIEDVDIR